MRNLFIGGSSEIAIDVAKKLPGSDCISQKKCKFFSNNLKIENYKFQKIKKIVKKIKIKYDNILIFNGFYEKSLLSFFSEKEFEKSFYINLKVPLMFASELISNKILNRDGSIFFFSSIAAKTPKQGNAYYSLSKNTLNFAAQILSDEQKKRGYRINVISLGLIKNKMGKSTLAYANKKNKFIKKKKYLKIILKTLKNKKINKKVISIR